MMVLASVDLDVFKNYIVWLVVMGAAFLIVPAGC